MNELLKSKSLIEIEKELNEFGRFHENIGIKKAIETINDINKNRGFNHTGELVDQLLEEITNELNKLLYFDC